MFVNCKIAQNHRPSFAPVKRFDKGLVVDRTTTMPAQTNPRYQNRYRIPSARTVAELRRAKTLVHHLLHRTAPASVWEVYDGQMLLSP